MGRLLDLMLAGVLFWGGPGAEGRALRSLERAIAAAPWQESYHDPVVGSSHAKQLAAFESFLVRDLGAVIRYLPRKRMRENGRASGQTRADIRYIQIDVALLPNARLQVLAHEAAHLLLPPYLAEIESELLAEEASFLVCRRLGLNTKRQAVRWLAAYKSGLATSRYWRRDLFRAVDRLTSWR